MGSTAICAEASVDEKYLPTLEYRNLHLLCQPVKITKNYAKLFTYLPCPFKGKPLKIHATTDCHSYPPSQSRVARAGTTLEIAGPTGRKRSALKGLGSIGLRHLGVWTGTACIYTNGIIGKKLLPWTMSYYPPFFLGGGNSELRSMCSKDLGS